MNIDMAFTAQRISHNIGFTRMILHIQIIILNKFQPSSLPEVQLSLSENVLQTLMISEYVTAVPNKIMPPCLQRMNNRCQLQVMCGILLLMVLKLTRSISNNPSTSHTTKFSTRCITINLEVLMYIRQT